MRVTIVSLSLVQLCCTVPVARLREKASGLAVILQIGLAYARIFLKKYSSGINCTDKMSLNVLLLWSPTRGSGCEETQLITSLQKSQHSNLAIEEGALALFDAVCHGLSKNHGPQTATKTNIRRQRLVDKTRNLLNSLEDDSQGAERNPTLSRIASLVGTSVYHLCRVFRDESGMTLHAYRQAQKLGRALKLMQSSQQDLTELAHELGFSSHSHFTRVFRQHLGEAPSRIQFA